MVHGCAAGGRTRMPNVFCLASNMSVYGYHFTKDALSYMAWKVKVILFEFPGYKHLNFLILILVLVLSHIFTHTTHILRSYINTY